MRRLVVVDEEAVVADCEADVTVKAICAIHQIPLNRRFRILDRYEVRAGNRTPRSCPSGWGA
jgi:hypothetical protein